MRGINYGKDDTVPAVPREFSDRPSWFAREGRSACLERGIFGFKGKKVPGQGGHPNAT